MGDQAHAQLMDSEYKFQRHFYDLTRKYYLLGRDTMLERMQVPPNGTVLEVGCGTGRNLIKAAKLYPDAQLFGIDISDEMLKTAQANISKAGLEKRIRLAKGDATDFSALDLFDLESFDRVFISYALSMIPPWGATLQHAASVLSGRGSLHIVDFGQQERLPKWFRALLFSWLRKFHVIPRAQFGSFLDTVAETKGLTAHYETLFRGYAVLGSLSRPKN